MNNQPYLKLLAKTYPDMQSALTEIINLQAIMSLPKGTEHFVSDIHGEYEIFLHILKNASGVIKRKIDEYYGDTLYDSDKTSLATLIYYPEERLKIEKVNQADHLDEWYRTTLFRMVNICKTVASKYTRSKVRKALPKGYEYIIDELIHTPSNIENKEQYYSNILNSIIELNTADNFIIVLSNLIQRLSIDHLHIIGDIFDRGQGADIIMDKLMTYHSLDIQWGNHDILWMGAVSGNTACIANIIRINGMYNNLYTLENAYGINLRPLATFALQEYKDDKCEKFKVKSTYQSVYNLDDRDIISKMHKAITILQLKLENAMIDKHPEFNMNDRKLFKETALTETETKLIEQLKESFVSSKRLREHINFLYKCGSMYKVYNNNLLMHGCVPTNEDGSFTSVNIEGESFSGKGLYDKIDSLARRAFFNHDEYALDFMWYLWCGKNSPVYGRNQMQTYERYFTDIVPNETKNNYYTFIKNEDFCLKVLKEFGIDDDESHVINGHMPVKVKDGERPDSANGRHITIDGGLAKAYHDATGIAGYTLISNSHGLFLVSHTPFSRENAINNSEDLHSKSKVLHYYKNRILVKDTDIGKQLSDQIICLKELVEYYKIK